MVTTREVAKAREARRFRPLSIAAAVLAMAGSGCSFVFSDGPPADHARMPYFDCTSTYGLSVADGFFTLSGGLVAITTLNQSPSEYAAKNDGANRNTAAAINIGMAAVFGASAVYGILNASKCNEAKEGLRARILRPMLPPGRAPMTPFPVAPPPPPSAPPPEVFIPPSAPPPPPGAVPATPPAAAPTP